MGNFYVRLIALFLALVFYWEFLPGVAFAQTSTPLSTQTSIQPYLDRVIENLTEFKLDNGMKFIVLQRTQAPVVSFLTYADVGGVDEPDGKTGVAHFLEHLAFKGTDRIGTSNYAKEKKLLNKLDQLAVQIEQANKAGEKDKVARLQAQFKKFEEQAHKIVKQNEFGRIVEQSGGVGLNATTSTEATKYFYSFPSNKLELWMSLESERFLNPVLRREFYNEKDVILEERRMRVDNSPIGQMIEKFNDIAFQKHPYKRPVIGYDEDIRNLTPEDVQQFFDRHYVPSKITVAVIGDVKPAEVRKMAEAYFGRYEAKSKPQQTIATEPKQTQEKEFTLNLPSQPWYLEGYHRPSLNHPDNAVYDIIGGLLSDGRTSRLYKSLVEKQQLALAAQGFSGFPGDKYPNLMLFYALTAPGHTVDEVATALREQIEALKTQPVSGEELQRVKTNARAGLLRSLDSNMGMAQQLLEYEVKTGSWKNLFKQLEKIEAVTAQDIIRVSQETFVSENRTVGKLLPKKSAS
ncbi:MAG: pitrilysin family protein [Cyanobacteria bacterium P01_D01_bin.50]